MAKYLSKALYYIQFFLLLCTKTNYLYGNVSVKLILLLFVDMSVTTTVIAIIGKGFSSASFATLVLYSTELFPTVVR